MVTVTPSPALDVEDLVNRVASDLNRSAVEDNKATRASVRAESSIISDKRQERIENLIRQMKGLQAGGGGCVKFLRTIFRVIDFLAKPLSALTLNKLKVDLTKVLDTLKDQKNQVALNRLKIRGDEILKSLRSFKQLLGDDTELLKTQDEQQAKDARRVMEILENLHETFETTTGR